MSNVRQLSMAQQTYAARSDDWMAGPNTSGARGIIENGVNYQFSTSATTPTTTHDWVSPSLGDELDFSPNRAERTFQLFSKFRCPRANEPSTVFGNAGDKAEFTKIEKERGGFGQVSYLAPAPFLYSGRNNTWIPRQLANSTTGAKPHVMLPDPFDLPAGYRPVMSGIKNTSMKVSVADGTRYVAVGSSFGRTALLDFDIAPKPSFYGSFTESPPALDIASGSVAYGRTYGQQIREVNVDLSMRFPGRQLHVGFFDGHAERITSTRAWSDPSMWYPTGSVYTGKSATPEIKAKFKAGERTP
jgi:prepilin-type processing-associated H-X9-DG protein